MYLLLAGALIYEYKCEHTSIYAGAPGENRYLFELICPAFTASITTDPVFFTPNISFHFDEEHL